MGNGAFMEDGLSTLCKLEIEIDLFNRELDQLLEAAKATHSFYSTT
jgi:hypothetical protein